MANNTANILAAKYPNHDFHFDVHGRVVFVQHDMEIYDPMVSDCGRFPMDPSHYGLSIADALIMDAHNAMIGDPNED